MEFKHDKYVWWDENEKESIYATLNRITEQKDKNGNPRKTQQGLTKYYLEIRTRESKELCISIVGKQRNFFQYQVGKTGTFTHNPENNYLTFEEDKDKMYDAPSETRQIQTSLSDYDDNVLHYEMEDYLRRKEKELQLELAMVQKLLGRYGE